MQMVICGARVPPITTLTILRVLYEAGGILKFRVDQPQTDLLRLTPLGPTSQQDSPVTLTRTALPKDYPLLHWKFHWVNEFEPLR